MYINGCYLSDGFEIGILFVLPYVATCPALWE